MGAPSTDQLPPHAPESESSVLGCCLIDPNCIDDCQVKLKAGAASFFDMRNGMIYETLCDMRRDGDVIDIVTLQRKLTDAKMLDKVGGVTYIQSLPDLVPSSANLQSYLEIVIDKHVRRKLLRACHQISQGAMGSGDVYSLIGSAQSSLSNLDLDESATLNSNETAKRVITDLTRRCELDGKRSGLVTGLHEWDALTDGLQFGEQTLVAARPSVGKTGIGVNVVERVCLTDGNPTIFATFEMSPAALGKRLFACHSSVSMGSIRRGTFTQTEHERFAAFVSKLNKAPLWIVDGIKGMDANQLAAEIRRLCRKHGIKLVVIDYLQKIRAPHKQEKRTYEVAEVSGVLKALAVETNAAFLTLAQLNREPDKDAKGRLPRVSDLADSGQIERDADCICLLHRVRTPETERDAKLIVGKQRDGEVGVVDLLFEGRYCRFSNPPSEEIKSPITDDE